MLLAFKTLLLLHNPFFWKERKINSFIAVIVLLLIEVVKFYAADGKLIGSSSVVDGTASCAVSETMVIAKFGDNAIKVAVK